MEKRIELEKRARKASQITELNLDNCRSTSIVGLSDEYTALETLSLINVGLTTLKGFPKLPNLKKLELSDNRISNGLNYLITSPKLQYLNLSGNKIKDLESLKPLEEFKNLAILDLFNNETTLIENYREKIFKMIPSLKYLDGLDCNDMEAPSENEDDVNGNDSYDDDNQMSFSINGLEIDLDELEELERRVKAKHNRAQETKTKLSETDPAGAVAVTLQEQPPQKVDEIDELDEYLRDLQLKEKATVETPPQTAKPISFALFLYWFLAILNLASAAYFSDSLSEEEDGSDDNDEDLEEEGDFDEGDVSLSEVYNEDIEDDNSDWDEEDAPADDDEDYDDFDDEEEGGGPSGNGENAEAKAKTPSSKGKTSASDAEAANNKEKEAPLDDESQTRGKKRKHDG